MTELERERFASALVCTGPWPPYSFTAGPRVNSDAAFRETNRGCWPETATCRSSAASSTGSTRRFVAASTPTPSSLEKGLAQLVLTLVDLLRQLMERQALRRIEGGSLTADEVERLGETFMLLEQRMEELKESSGWRTRTSTSTSARSEI